jgi:hypothetical protein
MVDQLCSCVYTWNQLQVQAIIIIHLESKKIVELFLFRGSPGNLSLATRADVQMTDDACHGSSRDSPVHVSLVTCASLQPFTRQTFARYRFRLFLAPWLGLGGELLEMCARTLERPHTVRIFVNDSRHGGGEEKKKKKTRRWGWQRTYARRNNSTDCSKPHHRHTPIRRVSEVFVTHVVV